MSKSYTAGDWIFQFVTITAGVLIALMFDGLAEWSREQTLVREARDGIARELADNRKQLEESLAAVDARDQQLAEAVKFADELLATGKSGISQIELGVSVAELRDASWATAEGTGALALMDYAEVQRLARLYRLQDLYNERQRAAMERLAGAFSLFGASTDPHEMPPKDLEAYRGHVLGLRADLYIRDRIAAQLLKNYGEQGSTN